MKERCLSKVHLWYCTLYIYQQEKNVTEAYSVNSFFRANAVSERTCGRRFEKFKNRDSNLEDENYASKDLR